MGVRPVEDLLLELLLILDGDPVLLFRERLTSPMFQHEHPVLVDVQGFELLVEGVVGFWSFLKLLFGGWITLDPFPYFFL